MVKLSKINGNNRIIKFINEFEENDKHYIVMEYCKHGTLRDYLKHKKSSIDIQLGKFDLKVGHKGFYGTHSNFKSFCVIRHSLVESNIHIFRARTKKTAFSPFILAFF